ncbi:sedoheptulokinase isoform X5 [Stigmatopora nigra]
MNTYALGVDLGTTSIKAVLLECQSRTVIASQTLPTASDISDSNGIKAKEQDTGRILETLDRCIDLLPRDKMQHVGRIGVSGQMHGVLFWNSERGCDWSKGKFSHLITWQDGRCDEKFLSSLPKPDSHLSVATGFGCATIFWYMKHRPAFLKGFTMAGTIQDYVVSSLCGLDKCLMTPQNSASWGFYNTSSNQWNVDILTDAGFPLHLLPGCAQSGELAGCTLTDWHGVPAGTPVGAALGDFQCAVYSCLSTQTDAARFPRRLLPVLWPFVLGGGGFAKWRKRAGHFCGHANRLDERARCGAQRPVFIREGNRLRFKPRKQRARRDSHHPWREAPAICSGSCDQHLYPQHLSGPRHQSALPWDFGEPSVHDAP